MKRIFNLFTTVLLFVVPLISKADTYPINKNIDVKHYVFNLSLSDADNEITGTTLVTISFKEAGMKNFRLDFINKTTARQNKGMVVDAVTSSNLAVNYTHQNDELIINLPAPSTLNQTLIFTIQYHGIPFDGLRIGATKLGDRSFFNENWPNRGRHWLPIVDHPHDKATSEFIVKAPSHYLMVY